MRSVGQTIKNGSLKIESVHKRSYIYYLLQKTYISDLLEVMFFVC